MDKRTWQILVVAKRKKDVEHLRALLEQGGGHAVRVRWMRSCAGGQKALASGIDALLVSQDAGSADGLALARSAVQCGDLTPVFLLVDEHTEPARLAELDAAALEAGAAGLLTWGELAAGLLWRIIHYAAQHRAGRGRPGGLATEQELRQLNRSLRASEQKYRALVESLQEGIWWWDEHKQTVFVNQHMADLLGCTVAEMAGQPLSRFITAEDLSRMAGERPPGQAGLPGQYELRLLHKTGVTLEVLVATTPLFDEQGEFRGAISGVIDMTDRKLILRALEEREAEARRYAGELERSNRELEQFAFIASHDLQEPLRKIKGFSERLETRYAGSLDEVGRDYLVRMSSAAERMQRMIRDLLAFSRVSTRGQPFTPVDLNAVAAEVVSDLEIRIQAAGASLTLGYLPVVEADRTQMYQLLQNLVNNALKYARKNIPPQVQVTAEKAVTPAGQAAVEIGVTDNGIGFPMSQAERIFQPFQRLHGRSEYEGSGIGLAICRKIVERHGGSIRAESQPGLGSRFIVVLPVKHR